MFATQNNKKQNSRGVCVWWGGGGDSERVLKITFIIKVLIVNSGTK